MRAGADDLGKASFEREFETLAFVEITHVVHAFTLDEIAFVIGGLLDLLDGVEVDDVDGLGDLVPPAGQDVECGLGKHLLERVFVGDVHEANIVLAFTFLHTQLFILIRLLRVHLEFLSGL